MTDETMTGADLAERYETLDDKGRDRVAKTIAREQDRVRREAERAVTPADPSA